MSKRSKGNCLFCGRNMTRSGLTKHLKSCSGRQEAISAAKQKPVGRIFHLLVQDKFSNDFWLHLEISGQATLADLDHYLRAIWLECCGHLSHFGPEEWGGNDYPMKARIDDLFPKVDQLVHVYDYGDSSVSLVKLVDSRQGSPFSRKPIYLMARNDLQKNACAECGEEAGWLCIECLYDEDSSPFLCDNHVNSHPHKNYGDPLPWVNSPRVGVCGYEGPAEPPY